MRYLVTGGAGFVGAHLVKRLVDEGNSVRILDDLVEPVHSPDRPFQPPEGVEFINGSVLSGDDWAGALDGVGRVFHLAGYADYRLDFSRYFLVNTVGTALLYETIVRDKLPVQKVVVASSQAMYGEGAHSCPTDGIVYPDARALEQLEAGHWDVACPVCAGPVEPKATDEENARPHNSYAMSKAAMENLTHALGRRYEIPSVAVRYSIVHGPGQSPYNAYSGALRSFAVKILNGNPPVVFEDGEQYRDYVNVHDVTDANMTVMESDEANFRSFNVGGDRWVTVTDLANLVIDVAGFDGTPEISGMYRVGDTRHIVSDVTSLKNLGWNPHRSLRSGVEEYWAWLKGQRDVPDTVSAAIANMSEQGILRGGRD